jgi:hypothetical protein
MISIRENVPIHQSYFGHWIMNRYMEDAELLKKQLNNLKFFRSTRHRPGSQWPICRCQSCQGIQIVKRIESL